MPGLVPSAGVSMDQRIRSLMFERGHADLVLDAGDPQLEPKLLDVLERLTNNREVISDAIGRTVVSNLKGLAKMGQYFEQDMRKRYPDFPLRTGTLGWEEYLPPMGPNLRSLTEKYEG